jgi:hypothetical protein
MIATCMWVLMLFASITVNAVQLEEDWQDAGVSDGVTLSFRDDSQVNARHVRAVAELPHAPDAIIDVVCDLTQLLDPDTRESRVLAGNIGADYEIYLRYAPRYMVVSARDVVLRVEAGDNGCAWSEIAGRLPPQAGAVRMPLLRGSWSVERIDADRSRVTYQIAVNPGGSIPGWMVRRGAVRALPDVIRRVARCLSLPERPGGRCPKPAS